jgi:signal transduction histidine kinase
MDKPGGKSSASDGLDLDAILAMPVSSTGERLLFPMPAADGTTRAIVKLHLPLSEETLYVEIGRADFSRELDSELPWKVFFDRLVDIADSALVRIQAAELESDAMQFEMNALLVHELKNPAEEFQQAVEWLDENVFVTMDWKADDSRRVFVDELKRSAWRFMELASAVVTPVVTDSRLRVPLREVRERIDRMYKARLAMQGIELLWRADDDWVIGAPLHLAHIVVVTLIQNAREAILEGSGRIHLEGEGNADAVLLHIDDSGCGIPEANRANIFKLGFTTKKRGSGRGLALAQRALHRLKGDLQLAAHAPAGFSTRFTVRFQRSKS